MKSQNTLSIHQKGRCRSCGNDFPLFLTISDTCNTCLRTAVAKMEEMNSENKKAAQGRTCVPLQPIGYNSPNV